MSTAVQETPGTILPIWTYGFKAQPECEEVTEFDAVLRTTVDSLWATSYSANGVGLSACQVGIWKRLAVIHLPPQSDEEAKYQGDVKIVMCNPVILESEGEQIGREGCLSLPGCPDDRVCCPFEVYFRFQDLDGAERKMVAQGLLARAVFHETEHCCGRYFFERTSSLRRNLLLDKYRKQRKLFRQGRLRSRVPLKW